MNHLLVFILAYGLFGALYCLQAKAERLRSWVPAIAGAGFLAAVLLAWHLAAGQALVYPVGGWSYLRGIVLVCDDLSLLFLLIIQAAVLAALVEARRLALLQPNTVFALFFLCTAGLNGMVLAGDLFTLFVFLELSTLAAYALVGAKQDGPALEGALKYVLMGFSGSFLILWATALVYGSTGTLNIAQAAGRVQDIPQIVQQTIAAMYTAGFLLKAGLFPTHSWKADAYGAALAPVSAFLSGAASKVALYALWRVLSVLFGWERLQEWGLGTVFVAVGLCSLLVGHMLAYRQERLQRLLAYSSAAHMGYILIGMGLFGSLTAFLGALFHMVNHGLLKAGLFLFAGRYSRSDTIDSLTGLFWREPLAAASFGMLAFGMAGIPPMNGFLSKWLLVLGAAGEGHVLAAAGLVVAGLLALFYYVPIIQIFFRPSAGADKTTGLSVTVIGAALLSFLLFAAAEPFLQWLTRSAAVLQDADSYIAAVLRL